jgi:catechol 2,3-dioxygenase-like lactoylglutathione lyase family enzyme
MEKLGQFPVHAVLPASDFDRAKIWYREKLGLTPSEEMGPNAWYRCADGTWFILMMSQFAGTARNTAAGFTIRDIEPVMEELRARGVLFEEYDFGEMGKTQNGLMSIGNVKVAWFMDSEGNIIELREVG